MTDTERRALSERIATLAEQAGLPSELVWEAAETCPQGHSNRDIECGDIELTTGDLCRECWREKWRDPRLDACQTDAEIDAVVDEEWAAYDQFDDPAFHPEWRIGREAKDFTDPTNLLPVVKAWITMQPDDEGWTYQVAWCVGQAVGNLYEVVDQDWGRHYDGDDAESEWVALALAFAEALEKGVES